MFSTLFFHHFSCRALLIFLLAGPISPLSAYSPDEPALTHMRIPQSRPEDQVHDPNPAHDVSGPVVAM